MAVVLLIGGAGLVGCHLALQLQAAGHEVWIYDNLHAYHKVSLARAQTNHLLLQRTKAVCTFHEASVIERSQLEQVFQFSRPQIVYYLAALLASESMNQPALALATQVEGLHNALYLAAECGSVQRFVLASSSYVYGDFEASVIDETHPRRPVDVYGRTKLIGEELVQIYHQLANLEYCIVRPAAIYGVGDARPRFASQAIDYALQGQAVSIYDPDFISDFTYIEDAIQGFERAAFVPEGANEIFNLTRGEAHTNRDFSRILATHFPHVTIHLVDSPEEEGITLPKRGALDISKAKRLLNYQPVFDLNTGIRHYIESYEALAQGRPLPTSFT